MNVLEQSKPLYQQVYDLIKKLLVSGDLEPGSKIVLSKLVETYQVSRTPLREALRQLQKEGLLIQDNSGTRVIHLHKKDFNELCGCRLLLEKEIVRLAVKEMTNEQLLVLEEIFQTSTSAESTKQFLEMNTQFHETIIHSISNKRLISLLEQIRSFLLLYRAKILFHHTDYRVEIISDHRLILEALLKRDENAAVQAIHDHVVNDQIRGSKLFDKDG